MDEKEVVTVNSRTKKFRYVWLLSVLVATAALAEWRYVREVDPITDVVNQSIITNEDSGNGWLAIACERFPGGRLDYGITVHLGDMDTRTDGSIPKVITRIDKTDPMTHEEYDWMRMSNSKRVSSKWNQSALVERMKQGKQFVIRVIDDSGIYTRIFDLTGLRDAAQKFDC
ncbi:MAG: hypothetical protein ACI92N_002453 [Pseudomonadales bacterium]|jgi:hypothetical protein